MKKILFTLSILSSVLGFAQETKDNNDSKLKEKEIESVVITKTKKAVEQKADRTIFDFSEQPSLNSGSLMEGVKKLPGLVVSDMVGMMYQGKPLDVYMDGRPLNISSNELNAFLEGMPANSVERIEIITQPGAEFPATSGGAILNIITSKSAKNYLTAVYNGGYRFSSYDKYRSRFNNSIALNSRNKWFGWQVNLGQYYRESLSLSELDALTRNHSNSLGRTYYMNSAFTFELGKDRLLLNYDINHNNGGADITSDNFLTDTSTANYTNNNGLRQEVAATYQKKFTDKNKKLDFKAVYTNSDSEFNQFGSQSLNNSSLFNSYNFRVDYSQPLKILDDGKVSFGGLYDQQDFETKDRSIINLDYTRQTTSAYVEFQATLKKFDFIAGARAENYDITGITRFYDDNDNLKESNLNPFKKFKVFPNASVQYNLMKQLFVNVNYNKKISLPSVSLLNPNNNILSTETVTSTGNPNLQPTIYDNAEIKISAFDYAYIGYNTSWVKNQIVQRVSRKDNFITNEQVQVNSIRTHNFNFGMPIPFMLFTTPFSELMKFNVNPDKMNLLYVYTGYQLQEMPDVKTKGFWIFSLMGQFILPKDIRLQANYNVIPKGGNFYYFEIEKPLNNAFDITISKKFMSDRLNLSLYARDIFNQNKSVIKAVSTGGNVFTSNKYDSRSFGITVNYKIPTKNKLAKEDPNMIKSTNQGDSNGGILQQGQ
ncbi:outer membrane beta-barrel protein [Chryseobacterium sp. Ch-15]|uniref:Outer membrane beta-barrel protein n=1 Tax=Chryseobacterium muglaense TaxID=2893752 RepID=A0A9Q3UTN3_9FLAO|nr:outer membrane beta-barrel protein [Chryseobacterium muglaense]MBD3904226.1 outer membrane beta-barrel protein [Chryseobacterium muglaense]MCC9035458.1 outer membrane beta-barrel protein [Chryseobacterium muglaense]MCM2553877.1 outer membrane beta-barrel protein [Chryseobacterium muglaense]